MTLFFKKQLRMFLWNVLIMINLTAIIWFFITAILASQLNDFNKKWGSAERDFKKAEREFNQSIKQIEKPSNGFEFNPNWK